MTKRPRDASLSAAIQILDQCAVMCAFVDTALDLSQQVLRGDVVFGETERAAMDAKVREAREQLTTFRDRLAAVRKEH